MSAVTALLSLGMAVGLVAVIAGLYGLWSEDRARRDPRIQVQRSKQKVDFVITDAKVRMDKVAKSQNPWHM